MMTAKGRNNLRNRIHELKHEVKKCFSFSQFIAYYNIGLISLLALIRKVISKLALVLGTFQNSTATSLNAGPACYPTILEKLHCRNYPFVAEINERQTPLPPTLFFSLSLSNSRFLSSKTFRIPFRKTHRRSQLEKRKPSRKSFSDFQPIPIPETSFP